MRPCVGRDSSTVVIGLSGRGDALELSDSDEPRSLDCVDARCENWERLDTSTCEGLCRRGNAQGASPPALASYCSDEFVQKQRCRRSNGCRRVYMDAVYYRTLLDQLIRIEGVSLAPYRDAARSLIVAPDDYVERMGVSATGMAVLEVDVRAVARDLEEQWPTVSKLDAVRQRVLIHLAFDMGVRGLLTMLRFVSAVEFRFWETAADDMLSSQWAKQEPCRARVLAAMMRTGRDNVLDVIQP